MRAAVLCLAAAAGAHGRGCGQPAGDPPDCTSQGWQCRRVVSGYCVRGIDGAGGPCFADDDCYSGRCAGAPFPRGSSGGNCSTAECRTQKDISAGCARDGNEKTMGYVCAAVAVVFFGSNFIPVKTHEAGNGIFFQWIVSCGIMFCGVCVQVARQNVSSTWHPYPMWGGVLWCTGNLLTVPIIKSVGLGLALCIWGAFNTLAGWSSGKFGLLGVREEDVGSPAVNAVGVGVALLAVFVFARVEPTLDDRPRIRKSTQHEYGVEGDCDSPAAASDALVQGQSPPRSRDPLADVRFGFGGFGTTPKPASLQSPSQVHQDDGYGSSPESPASRRRRVSLILENARDVLAGNDDLFIEMLGSWRRPFGVICAAASGSLQGLSFDPAQKLADHAGEYSREKGQLYSSRAIDYAFSHFSGIFLTSSCVMLFYALLKRCLPKYNRPVAYASIVLPGFLSGVIWAAGACCWFVANTRLGLVTAFPIITTGPGLVSAFWGVFVFKEIKGRSNLVKLLSAFVLLGVAVGLIASSQSDDN